MPVQTRSQHAKIQKQLRIESSYDFIEYKSRCLVTMFNTYTSSSDKICAARKFGMEILLKIPGFVEYMNQNNRASGFRFAMSMYNKMKCFSKVSSTVNKETNETLIRCHYFDIDDFEKLMEKVATSIKTEFENVGLIIHFDENKNIYALTKNQHTFFL